MFAVSSVTFVVLYIRVYSLPSTDDGEKCRTERRVCGYCLVAVGNGEQPTVYQEQTKLVARQGMTSQFGSHIISDKEYLLTPKITK